MHGLAQREREREGGREGGRERGREEKTERGGMWEEIERE